MQGIKEGAPSQGSGGAARLLSLQGLPVMQNMTYSTPEEAQACPVGDLELVQDPGTGLVHNRAFRGVDYGPEYTNEAGHSPRFRKHMEAVADVIERRFPGQELLEVGCGRGRFLEILWRRGFLGAQGVDPAYPGEDSRILAQPFAKGQFPPGKGLILRHVLEHIPDPLAFLEGLRDANGGGLIYIEVPDLDWILKNGAWFDLYYEHVNYFRLPDLFGMFGTKFEAGYLFEGQYLYIVADLATLRRPAHFEPVAIPEGFGTLSIRSPAAVWGAASKGVMLALAMQRAGTTLDFAIDINPAMRGRYLPVTGLRVVHPQDLGDMRLDPDLTLYVANSAYLQEIRGMIGGRFTLQPIDGGAA